MYKQTLQEAREQPGKFALATVVAVMLVGWPFVVTAAVGTADIPESLGWAWVIIAGATGSSTLVVGMTIGLLIKYKPCSTARSHND